MNTRRPRHRQSGHQRRDWHRPHRRGAVYLAVLGTSLLVTMIGISAMLTNRAIHRAGETTHRALEARYLSHAAVELGLRRINNDPNWRSNHTHTQWAIQHALGAGKIRYRLLAVTGTDLTSPADGHVYLEAQGDSGRAIHRTRVTLQPADQLAGVNRTKNPNLDDGTRYWRAGLDADELEYTLASAYTGAGSLRVRNLTGSGSLPSVRQDVSDWLESGQSYRVGFAIHLLDKDRNVNVRFIVNDNVVATETFSGLSISSWAERTATLTPTWSGSISTAYLEIAAHQHTDFLLDAVSVIPADATYRMIPVPGSWQQTVVK